MAATLIRKPKKIPGVDKFDPSFIPPPRINPDNLAAAEHEDLLSKHNAKAYTEAIEKRAAKSRHGKKPEFLNNTTTPAGIAANDPDAAQEWQQSPEGVIQQLDLEDLVRHPDNRRPTEPDIAAMASRLLEQGQLEPIVVWQPPPGLSQWHGGKSTSLVILSGETRYLGALRLNWESLQGRIASGLTPAQALEHLAAFNGERRDLDPMQKARLINRLCQPVADGGAGLTRQQAGERVGMETGSAASNLVRLLELPKKWQDRVAAGELAWTWAREMIPYLPVFKAIDEELDRDWKNRETDRWDNAFESRKALVEQLERIADEACPRLDRTEIWVGNKHRKLKIDVKDPDTIDKLGIVELELATGKKGQTEKVPVATNRKAFDELVTEFKVTGAKASASKAGDDDAPVKRELTPAEKKQKAADRTRQRNERIAAWRDKLLRRELVCELDNGADTAFRFVLAYAAAPSYLGPSFDTLLCLATGKRPTTSGHRDVHWPCVAELCSVNSQAKVLQAMAKHLLTCESTDWRRPTMPHGLIDAYAADLHVDVAAAWRNLQIAGDGNKLAGEDLLEEFFLLHQTEELRDLAKELGKHVPESANRAAMVKLLLGVSRGTNQRLPLPKSIKPVAGVKTAKAKKGAK